MTCVVIACTTDYGGIRTSSRFILSVGADSPPAAGTGRRGLTQMEQRRRRYAAVPCRRRASTLPGSGRLAG